MLFNQMKIILKNCPLEFMQNFSFNMREIYIYIYMCVCVSVAKGNLGIRACTSLCRLITKAVRVKENLTLHPQKIICLPPPICKCDVK